MGSGIAALLAKEGLPVVLLDIVPANADSAASRSALAVRAIEGLLKSKPAAFYENSSARLITLGNFEDDLNLLVHCDWIVEAVSENLSIKQALLAKIAPHLRPDAIVTTNTSGLLVNRSPLRCRQSFAGGGLGRIFLIRRVTCACLRSSLRPRPTRQRWLP